MRINAALLLFVYLPLTVSAATDSKASPHAVWDQRHKEGKQAYSAKNYSKSESLFLECFQLATSSVERGIAANDLGHALHNLNREREARVWFERALSIWREQPGYNDPAAHTAIGLADVLRSMGDYPGALKIQAEALAFQNISPETRAEILNAQADLVRETGSFELAFHLFSEALDTPGIPEQRRLDSLLGLGELSRHFGDHAKSVEYFQQAQELADQLHNGLLSAVAMRGLAQTYVEARTFARADPLYRRALSQLEAVRAPSQQIAITLACTGDLYRLEGKLALAEDAWSRTIAIEKSSLGENHPQVGLIMAQLAELYSSENRMELAETCARDSYRIMSSALGSNSAATGAALASVALVEARQQHLQDAAKHYETSLTIMRKANMANDTAMATILDRYAAVLKAMHRGREAKSAELEARNIQKNQNFLAGAAGTRH